MQNFIQFQFLIGRLATSYQLGWSLKRGLCFNSLQVGSQHTYSGEPSFSEAEFQFLIGRLATGIKMSKKVDLDKMCFNSLQVGSQRILLLLTFQGNTVSIPYRQARNLACHFVSAQFCPLFQFLIGRLATLLVKAVIHTVISVSIPYRQARNSSCKGCYSYGDFCFNSLQVGSQRSIATVIGLSYLVSIPYRQARNSYYFIGAFRYLNHVSIPYRQARNLIVGESPGEEEVFQFLIGRLATLPSKAIMPSGEPSFNSLQVGSQRPIVFSIQPLCFAFQFLIGRLATQTKKQSL